MKLTRKETDYIFENLLTRTCVSPEEYNESINSVYFDNEFRSLDQFSNFLKDEINAKRDKLHL